MKCLVVCYSGIGRSQIVAQELKKLLPHFDIEAVAIEKVPGNECDLIITFEPILQEVLVVAEDTPVRTSEEMHEMMVQWLENYLRSFVNA